MRIKILNLIKDLLKESNPTFTDKKLWDLRVEKALEYLNLEINQNRLNRKIRYEEKKE